MNLLWKVHAMRCPLPKALLLENPSRQQGSHLCPENLGEHVERWAPSLACRAPTLHVPREPAGRAAVE